MGSKRGQKASIKCRGNRPGMPEANNDDKERRRRDNLTEFVRTESAAKGFDLCRITRPDAIPQAKERLGQFIDAGRHGTMAWMAETRDRRGDPRTLWSEVHSVVVFGLNYTPEEDPRGILDKPDKAAISVYARNRDYHDVIKGRLKEIATRFAARAGADVKVFVDTAPVMEKPLAEAAGLGWQGKHTNLVSRVHGLQRQHRQDGRLRAPAGHLCDDLRSPEQERAGRHQFARGPAFLRS